jgi:hypothetical protein
MQPRIPSKDNAPPKRSRRLLPSALVLRFAEMQDREIVMRGCDRPSVPAACSRSLCLA